MRFGCKNFGLDVSQPCLVIAEIGVNHNNDIDLAKRMIDAAVEAGAHVVKFQAFCTEMEISRRAAKAAYQQQDSQDQDTQFDLCKRLELSQDSLRHLFSYCHGKNIPTLCAAFDDKSLTFMLQELHVETVKVPSSEVTNIPFLRRIGSTGADVILSTGASTLAEVAIAVETLRDAGCGELMVFHCVSEYPAPHDQVNVQSMLTIRDALHVAVGFSDHTLGTEVATIAAALGACAIEKHFTLDRSLPGPDHKASIEPSELAALVRATHIARTCLGDGIKKPAPCEQGNRPLIRKGLVATRDLQANTILTCDMFMAKRPALGIAPDCADIIEGMTLQTAIAADEPITWAALRQS